MALPVPGFLVLARGMQMRLHPLSTDQGMRFLVAIGETDEEASPASLVMPGSAAALFVMPAGVAWVDDRSEALARAALTLGGAALFLFTAENAASLFFARLKGVVDA